MDMARPILVISILLATLTLVYTGRWAGTDPRTANELPTQVSLTETESRSS